MTPNQQISQISVLEGAKFLLSLDPNREYFTKESMSNVTGISIPMIGNFRLNKMLHITQMLYASKYGHYLFLEKMWAFEHGGMFYDVYRGFHSLVDLKNNLVMDNINSLIKNFLTEIYRYFKTYSDRQLEKFVHEDPAWVQIWEQEGKQKNMPQSSELLDYYREFASHIVKSVGL